MARLAAHQDVLDAIRRSSSLSACAVMLVGLGFGDPDNSPNRHRQHSQQIGYLLSGLLNGSRSRTGTRAVFWPSSIVTVVVVSYSTSPSTVVIFVCRQEW